VYCHKSSPKRKTKQNKTKHQKQTKHRNTKTQKHKTKQTKKQPKQTKQQRDRFQFMIEMGKLMQEVITLYHLSSCMMTACVP